MNPPTPKCPQCGSIIYSRRNVLCGVCGKRLPEELLFTPAERAAVEHDIEVLKQREQETRRREAEREAEQRRLYGRYGMDGS